MSVTATGPWLTLLADVIASAGTRIGSYSANIGDVM
jgi:hypothetical protein